MLRTIFSLFVDILLPPRRTDLLVRRLNVDELLNIQTERGFPYQDPRVTALVWEIKYYANARAAAMASAMLAPQVTELAAEDVGRPLLIPVPMHAARRKERGHNQTETLCAALLPHLPGIEYRSEVLVRTKNTPHQQGLARHMRLHNVKNSMRASGAVRGRTCIVVDDVTTTGATLAEAARALTEAGAHTVHTIALAYS